MLYGHEQVTQPLCFPIFKMGDVAVGFSETRLETWGQAVTLHSPATALFCGLSGLGLGLP